MAIKQAKLKLKRGKIFTFLKKLLSIFKHKPKIINLSGEELKDKAIYLGNHAGANGPMTYEMFFPKRLTPWGAHEMCEGIKSRWKYLYHVFYRQKLHWNKFRAFFVATVFCPFSILLYRAIGLIPTFTDMRFVNSLRASAQVLDANSALLIFPEDSTEGYKNPPDSFNPGFVALAKVYEKMSGDKVPVYVTYFDPKKRKITISKPFYVQDYFDNGETELSIAKMACDLMHSLSEME